MLFVLGLSLFFLGSFALWMMHVTGNIPNRLPMKWHDDDPIAFRRWWIVYNVIAGLGAVMILMSLFRP
jgi:hypothetical protein